MKNWQKVREANKLFDSILCLCCEGPELLSKIDLVECIKKEAMKGYNLTDKPTKE